MSEKRMHEAIHKKLTNSARQMSLQQPQPQHSQASSVSTTFSDTNDNPDAGAGECLSSGSSSDDEHNVLRTKGTHDGKRSSNLMSKKNYVDTSSKKRARGATSGTSTDPKQPQHFERKQSSNEKNVAISKKRSLIASSRKKTSTNSQRDDDKKDNPTVTASAAKDEEDDNDDSSIGNDKREKRKEQNRRAAHVSRNRKRLLTDELQHTINVFAQANTVVRQKNYELECMIQQAQSYIDTHLVSSPSHSNDPSSTSLLLSGPTAAAASSSMSSPAKATAVTTTAAAGEKQEPVVQSLSNNARSGSSIALPPVGTTMDAMLKFQMAITSNMESSCSSLVNQQQQYQQYHHHPNHHTTDAAMVTAGFQPQQHQLDESNYMKRLAESVASHKPDVSSSPSIAESNAAAALSSAAAAAGMYHPYAMSAGIPPYPFYPPNTAASAMAFQFEQLQQQHLAFSSHFNTNSTQPYLVIPQQQMAIQQQLVLQEQQRMIQQNALILQAQQQAMATTAPTNATTESSQFPPGSGNTDDTGR